MTETTERPLVTFVVIAYNQERFIREAIEGAFAQTYQPLEIILSDDCSSDRTYEIMQDMAAAYDGPHEVRAVQTGRNIGVSSHVFLRGKEAKGQIVVLAAGDDISKPERCERHVEIYRDSTVMGVSGGFDLIDACGELLSADCNQPIDTYAYERQRRLFLELEHPYVVIQGSTASYRHEIFKFELPEWQIQFSEDNLFNFLIYAHGFRVAQIQEALVKYRQHDMALSNRPFSKKNPNNSEQELLFYEHALNELHRMDSFLWIAENSINAGCVNFNEIQSRRCAHLVVTRWPTLGLLQRVASIIQSAKEKKFRVFKWKAARIFGSLPDYQPRSLIRNRLRG